MASAQPEVPNGWTEWYGLIDHSTYRMWGYSMYENGHGDAHPTATSGAGWPASTRRTYSARRRSSSSVGARATMRRSSSRSATSRLTTSRATRSASQGSWFARRRVTAGATHTRRSTSRRTTTRRTCETNRRSLPAGTRCSTPKREAQIVKRMRERWESLLAVDDAVEAIIEELARHGRARQHVRDLHLRPRLHAGGAPNPAGEDGALRRLDPGPAADPWTPDPARPPTKALVGDVDIAPTIMDATPARIRRSRSTECRSCRSRATRVAPTRGRSSMRPRGRGATGAPTRARAERRGSSRECRPGARCAPTRWLYIEYKGGSAELYDLPRDRCELNSVADDPNYLRDLRTMRRILGDLSRCRGAVCLRLPGEELR